MVKQMDIVRGPTSATYGSGGMGGVMALQTIDAEDVLKPGQAIGGWVKTGHRTGDDLLSQNATAAAQDDGASIFGAVTYRDIYSLRTGTGQKLPNDGDVADGLLKTTYAPNENNSFKLGYQQEFELAVSPQNPSGNLTNTNLQRNRRTAPIVQRHLEFADSGQGLIDGIFHSYLVDNSRLDRSPQLLAGRTMGSTPRPMATACRTPAP